MSKDWTPEELQSASQAMKEAGHLSYEEFFEELERIDQAETMAKNSAIDGPAETP